MFTCTIESGLGKINSAALGTRSWKVCLPCASLSYFVDRWLPLALPHWESDHSSKKIYLSWKTGWHFWCLRGYKTMHFRLEIHVHAHTCIGCYLKHWWQKQLFYYFFYDTEMSIIFTCSFRQIHQETFGKSGCRRIVPGQYLAVDPKGRAIMIGMVYLFIYA